MGVQLTYIMIQAGPTFNRRYMHSVLHIILWSHCQNIIFNTLCVPSSELIGLVQWRTGKQSPIDPTHIRQWTLQWDEQAVCTPMITCRDHSSSDFTTSTLLHSPGWRRCHMAGSGWENGSREAQRRTTSLAIELELKCCFLCREHLSGDHYQTSIRGIRLVHR